MNPTFINFRTTSGLGKCHVSIMVLGELTFMLGPTKCWDRLFKAAGMRLLNKNICAKFSPPPTPTSHPNFLRIGVHSPLGLNYMNVESSVVWSNECPAMTHP